MKNIILDRNYKGLKQIDNGYYMLDGDLIIDGKTIKISKESFEALKEQLINN